MKNSLMRFLVLIMLSGFLVFNIVSARELYENSEFQPIPKTTNVGPYSDYAVHTSASLGMTITNMGQIGNGFFSGASSPSFQYPYPGQADYLFAGALWIGAVVGRDTLVSVGADGWQFVREMWPDAYPNGEIQDVSTSVNQSYKAVFYDTLTDAGYVNPDPTDGRPHIPLGLEITQTSTVTAGSPFSDFVIFQYEIKNIGAESLEDVYLGFYVDGDVKKANSANEFDDDICGFKEKAEIQYGNCNFIDDINIAWIADNSGKDDDAYSSSCDFPAATGMTILATPSDSLQMSFNWWVSNGNASLDWGPRLANTEDDPFRDFGGNLGTPSGDKNKYYIMRHPEFDYDQIYSAINHTAQGWLPPNPVIAPDLADGYDTRYLLSFGPFDIDPGETLPLAMAYVAGDNFHAEPCDAFENYFDANHPDIFESYLNYDDLVHNVRMARMVYDNPGVDTDEDGYSGQFMVCNSDTIYVTGDGVPDMKGLTPPTCPTINIETGAGQITMTWNGFIPETEKDWVNREQDFEGYRVWLGNGSDPADMVAVDSYDREDYYIYYFSNPEWRVYQEGASRQQIEDKFGAGIDPANYPQTNPLFFNDTIFSFADLGPNNSDLSDPMKIHKVYPDQPYPSTLNLTDLQTYYPDEVDSDGYPKYFAYEYVFDEILPGYDYCVGLSASDRGDIVYGLPPLETDPEDNYLLVSPTDVGEPGEHLLPEVFTVKQNYPNPFNPGTVIEFTVPSKAHIKADVYNLLGEKVKILTDTDYPSGTHTIIWDGTDEAGVKCAAGVYFYTISSANFSESRKMVLLK